MARLRVGRTAVQFRFCTGYLESSGVLLTGRNLFLQNPHARGGVASARVLAWAAEVCAAGRSSADVGGTHSRQVPPRGTGSVRGVCEVARGSENRERCRATVSIRVRPTTSLSVGTVLDAREVIVPAKSEDSSGR